MGLTDTATRKTKPREKQFKLADGSSNTIRIGMTTAKGYLKSQFEDAFERYLSAASANVTASQTNICEGSNATDGLSVTSESVTTTNN